MKQFLLVLAIGLSTISVQAQTRTFSSEVKLNKLAEPTGNDDILVINSENKVSSIPVSDLNSEPTPQTLSIIDNELTISDGNTVVLPTPQASSSGVQTESGTFTVPELAIPNQSFTWSGTANYIRVGNVVTFTIEYLLAGTISGTQPLLFTNVLPYSVRQGEVYIGNADVLSIKNEARSEILTPRCLITRNDIRTFLTPEITGWNEDFYDFDFGAPYSNVYLGENDAYIHISGTYVTDDPFN